MLFASSRFRAFVDLRRAPFFRPAVRRRGGFATSITVPVLRGLSAREPLLHGGNARSVADVVEFYDERFHIGLTDIDEEDLVNFLKALQSRSDGRSQMIGCCAGHRRLFVSDTVRQNTA